METLEEQLQELAQRIEQSLTPEDRAAAEQEKEQERLLRDEKVQVRGQGIPCLVQERGRRIM